MTEEEWFQWNAKQLTEEARQRLSEENKALKALSPIQAIEELYQQRERELRDKHREEVRHLLYMQDILRAMIRGIVRERIGGVFSKMRKDHLEIIKKACGTGEVGDLLSDIIEAK